MCLSAVGTAGFSSTSNANHVSAAWRASATVPLKSGGNWLISSRRVSTWGSSGNYEVLSARLFSPDANCWNDGPRSGIERQIIGRRGPVYSSRIVNLVMPPPCGDKV